RKAVASTFFRPVELKDTPIEFQVAGVFPRGRRTKDIAGFVVSSKGISRIMREKGGLISTTKSIKTDIALEKYLKTFTPEQRIRIETMIKENLEAGTPEVYMYKPKVEGVSPTITTSSLSLFTTGITITKPSPVPSGIEIEVSPTISPIVSPKISPRISPYISPVISPSPLLSPSPSPYLRPSPRPSPYLRPSPKPSPYLRPSPRPSPKLSPYLKPSPRPSPYLRPSPRLSPKLSPYLSPLPTPSPTPITTVGKPLKKVTEKRLMKKLKKVLGYQLYVKRFGEFKAIDGVRPKGRAIQAGERITRETLARTFRVTPTKQYVKAPEIPFVPSPKVFRRYKVRRGVKVPLQQEWIQRAKFSLGTRGEVLEIKAARRKSKSKIKLKGGFIR
ncbi:unnamed protein product, partial [marine sediment metagenome]